MVSINSRVVALLLATLISLVTTAFLSLVEGLPPNALWVAGSLSFVSSFLLVYVTFEFLIFREIEKVYAKLKEVAGESEDLPGMHHIYTSRNPVRRINKELMSYVSQRENEIDALKQHEAFRQEFIADISHELRTPVFAAQGYILTLLDGAMEDKNVRHRFLKKAAKSLNRLDTLVRDLLTLSRIEAGVIVMQPEIFDIQTLVLDNLDQLESKAKKRGIELRLQEIHPDGIYVYADPDRISQVFDNLISNAILYGKDDGWVEVRLFPQGKNVLVQVADNGRGIPGEHVNRVFERFYRVEKSRSKKQGGSGLGLAITKHIIESHHSSISVESKVDQGAVFSFFLHTEKPQVADAKKEEKERLAS